MSRCQSTSKFQPPKLIFRTGCLQCRREGGEAGTNVIYIYEYKRVIHKSLWDFRPLRYSSRDGHAEGEHVNRGRDTPSFCPTLQVLDMSILGDPADVNPANSKSQNAFLFPVHDMFRHDCPLAVKPASTPEILYLLICSFLLCLSCLLRSRVRSSGGTYELTCILRINAKVV